MTTEDGDARARAVTAFDRTHGHPPTTVVRAPGRVNLIGEHTDYNDGFVLPLALPHATVIALEPTGDRSIDVTSEGFGRARFTLDDDVAACEGWARYLHGMSSFLAADGHRVAGWRGTMATDIPAGAGLSSSAALEVAAGLAALAATGAEGGTVAPAGLRVVAALGTRVENELLGLPSGIMDQLISAVAVEGSALLIDCESGSAEPVAIPEEALVVILDTGTRRELADSAFAQRRADCARAAALLDVPSLRRAPTDAVPRLRAAGADDVLCRRVRHVVAENARTVETARALAEGDLDRVGRLMAESHRSLAVDYEVSGPALDAMVAVAADAPGVIGARMTGGGFAGCAVALVEADTVDRFCRHVLDRYRAPATQPVSAPARLYPVRPSAGASVSAP